MSRTRSADDGSILVERTAGLTAVVGAFVMASAVVFTITGTMGIHNALIGIVTAFIAAFHAFWTSDRHSPSIVLAAVLALLGVWIAASPFVFGVSRELVIGVNGVAGALVAILSLVGAYGSRRASNARAAGA